MQVCRRFGEGNCPSPPGIPAATPSEPSVNMQKFETEHCMSTWGAAAAPLSYPPPTTHAAAGERRELTPPTLWLVHPPWGCIRVYMCCWACSPCLSLAVPSVVGTRPRVLGAAGFPSWHWRVGEQRLWRVICTVLTDWRQHRTPVRGFVDYV